jgi:hypothetical protein
MKNLILFSILLFVTIFSFGQRNAEDSINLLKVKEIMNLVKVKLSGNVSEKDVNDLTNYLWNTSSKSEFQFFCLLNPDLYEMNSDPNQKIDGTYLNKAFTQLKNKQNVRVELVTVYDYYDFYDNKHKKSDYLIEYKIHFVNETSFGKNTVNYIDFKVNVISGKVTAIIFQPYMI